jgi:glycosyltransferase involved in cell wall biosynthesis
MSSPAGGVKRQSRDTLPFISVVIPVYNDCHRLNLCLAALSQQTYPQELFEVIIVDNGSKEEVDNVVNVFPFARLARELHPGSYAARNRGLSEARGEVIAFTDADCIPAEGWLENGWNALQSVPDCGLVGGRVEIFFSDPRHPSASEVYDSLTAFTQKTNIEQHQFSVTANLLTRRDVFANVGVFDQDLKSQGDLVWGRRTHKAGYRAVFSEEAFVRHPARRTLREIIAKNRRIAGGFYVRLKKRPRFYARARLFTLANLWPSVSRDFWCGPRYQNIHVAVKFKVTMVALCVACVRAFEILRLYCGGSPRR